MTARRTRSAIGGLGAGRSQDPFAEFDDEAGIFGDRDEFGRRNRAALRMTPAQQRLAAGYLVTAKIDNGLVVNLEAAIEERLAQIPMHGLPRLCACVHRRLEEAVGPPPAGLGAVHGQIGILDEFVQISAVAWSERDADAGIG